MLRVERVNNKELRERRENEATTSVRVRCAWRGGGARPCTILTKPFIFTPLLTYLYRWYPYRIRIRNTHVTHVTHVS